MSTRATASRYSRIGQALLTLERKGIPARLRSQHVARVFDEWWSLRESQRTAEITDARRPRPQLRLYPESIPQTWKSAG